MACSCLTNSCPRCKHSRHQTWNRSSPLSEALQAPHYQILPFHQSKTIGEGTPHEWKNVKDSSQLFNANLLYIYTFMLTGKSWPVCWKASMAWIHPRTGPLSSVEPLPKSLPSRSVSTNGSVSHPSSCATADISQFESMFKLFTQI